MLLSLIDSDFSPVSFDHRRETNHTIRGIRTAGIRPEKGLVKNAIGRLCGRWDRGSSGERAVVVVLVLLYIEEAQPH